MGELLDAGAVRRWCRLAADALGRAHAEIDALNVFPVPDGDTGTNLHLTVLAAAEEVAALPDDADATAVWRALAQGALLGARGNSGVILSQILRGLADVLGAGGGLGEALRHASRLAYGAVAHPVEGTMLSVLREAGAACPDGEDPGTAAWTAAARARAALRETTGRLEVLARNGVVDAGAAGLCVLLDTLAAVISGEFPETYDVPRRDRAVACAAAGDPRGPQDGDLGDPGDDGSGAAYEVMYLIDVDDERVPELRAELDRLGDSLVVVGGGRLWNVHVHTDDAGAAVEAGVRAGRPHRIRVTYLRAREDRPARAPGRGVVAVTTGDGLAALLREHGATTVRREPGRTPGAAELAAAIAAAGDEVVVLPDDAAVIPVAEAAAERARERGVRVAVVPAKASPQILAALAVHDPLRRFDDDVIAMTHAAGATRFGRVETAREEAVTSAGVCRPGDTLGLIGDEVCVIGADPAGVAASIIDRMLAPGGELLTLIIGADAPEGLADALRDHAHARRPDVEIAVYHGGQARHPLLVGVD